jgi:hypothetical protein
MWKHGTNNLGGYYEGYTAGQRKFNTGSIKRC